MKIKFDKETKELIIIKKGTEFKELDIEEIERFKKHCIDHALAGQLWVYQKVFDIATKFRKKQNKLLKSTI